MKIEINIKNTENIEGLDTPQLVQINDIIEALIASGGLT